jgi:phosphoribulokinase
VCESPFLFDKGSKITWVPNGDKLTTSAPGVMLASYDDEWFGEAVSVIEMDGKIDVLDELIYVESAMCSTGTKYYGELTEQMVKNKQAPGSENGTGLFQTLCAFKIREAYEALRK